jgi:hypothetical protein
MSDVNLEKFFFVHPEKYLKWKITICNWLNFEKSKNPVLEHRVVGAKKILTKIFTVKNCPRSEIFKLAGPFYQVLIFCSGGLIICGNNFQHPALTIFIIAAEKVFWKIHKNCMKIIFFNWMFTNLMLSWATFFSRPYFLYWDSLILHFFYISIRNLSDCVFTMHVTHWQGIQDTIAARTLKNVANPHFPK